MAIPVKLQVFEGPLDLLLHLIDINKIDIYDIPISLITDQYLAYIHQMEKQDMEIMSEFLVMAATLLKIKSKMLLPVEKKTDEEIADGEDPRQELVERLLEYKMYKYAAEELKDMQLDAGRAVFKPMTLPEGLKYEEPPVDLKQLVGGMTLEKLHGIFKSIIRRQNDRIDPIRSKYGKIEKEEISLADKMAQIEAYGQEHRKFSFRGLLERQRTRTNTIVTFLAVLELMKSGKIQIVQDHLFDDIQINMVEDADGNRNDGYSQDKGSA